MRAIKQDFQWIRQEAERCLYCLDAPCIKGCPAEINIPQFIRHIRYNDLKSAKSEIVNANAMGTVCGTLCPSETLCERKCVLNASCNSPIAIRDLQKYACEHADYSVQNNKSIAKTVAVVGGGPAGLACAQELAVLGYTVHLFEKEDRLGGLVQSEIPFFRIADSIIEKNLSDLQNSNICISKNHAISESDLMALREEYDAVFLGVGLQQDFTGGLETDEEKNIYNAGQFLRGIKAKKILPRGRVVIIGGGDSALDCASSALEYGAEQVILAYRRTRNEMPATDEEFLSAISTGLEVMYLVSPKRIEKIDSGLNIIFIRNRMGNVGVDGRREFSSLEGSEFTLHADSIVFALGKRKTYLNGENKLEEMEDVFIGGDFANGGKTIVQAVREGKMAASAIASYLHK